MSTGNESAYPWGEHGTVLGGLTKRELFAAMAMQALIGAGATLQIHTEEGVLTLPARVGVPKLAVEYADALLAQLSKEPGHE